MSVVDTLKGCPLFRGFSDTGVLILAGIASERNFPKGVPLFVENMIGDSLLVIGEGRVRLSSKGTAGEDILLGDLGPADYLGELTLIQQGQRMCTATALTGVSCVEIRHADFQRLLAQKPQACLKLLMGVVSLFGQKLVENKDSFKALIARK